MPVWKPMQEWNGQDAFIVGGGFSLIGFPFAQLKGRNTIGCNDAFKLGSEIIQICLFGDASFFHQNRFALDKFTGRMVTCAPSLLTCNTSWLWQMHRTRDGLHDGSMLGWNYSTGAAAVNLAVTLGATRIFLLGFDMGKREDGKSHWHPKDKVIQDEAYRRFIRGFQTLAGAIAKRPAVSVYNITDGSSKLPVFPRMTFAQFFETIQEKETIPT